MPYLFEYFLNGYPEQFLIPAASMEEAQVKFDKIHEGINKPFKVKVHKLEIKDIKHLNSETLEEVKKTMMFDLEYAKDIIKDINDFRIDTTASKAELKSQMKQLKALQNKLKVFKWSLQVAIAQKD